MRPLPWDCVWAPVFPDQEPEEVELFVRNSVSLAGWLGAQIYWLVSESQKNDFQRWAEFASSKVRCSIIPLSGQFMQGVLKLVSQSADSERGLLLLSAKSPSLFELLEQCSLPVWIVPAGLRMKPDPIHAIWVPMSGEKRDSEALDFGIRLANQHGLPVDILHVTSSQPKNECDESVLGHIRDQFHHEYPRLVEELVVEGSPLSTPRERQVIREFCHSYGDVIEEIKWRVRQNNESLLLFEWKGVLKKGRAEKIKLLLRHARGPVLLIRERTRARSRLKIGRHFGATG
ncbi:hypothetical protein WDW37_07855 [Bdellovibrionota bacterium FG-1]